MCLVAQEQAFTNMAAEPGSQMEAEGVLAVTAGCARPATDAAHFEARLGAALSADLNASQTN
jgi:hypothetical protein